MRKLLETLIARPQETHTLKMGHAFALGVIDAVCQVDLVRE